MRTLIAAILLLALTPMAGRAAANDAAFCRQDLIEATLAGERALEIDRKIFFDEIRAKVFGGSLSQSDVDGIVGILDHWDRHREWKDIRWLAYLLATAHHETARTMQPVRETLASTEEEAIRRLTRFFGRIKSYFRRHPETGHSYFGRGLVQLTWDYNYKAVGKMLGIGALLFLNPGSALLPKWAIPIIFEGMLRGSFVNGHCLPRYFRDGLENWVGARRIVNGNDKAKQIAQRALVFLKALEMAQVTPGTLAERRRERGEDVVTPDVGAPPEEAPPEEAPPEEEAVEIIARLAAIEERLDEVAPTSASLTALQGELAALRARVERIETTAAPQAAQYRAALDAMLDATEASLRRQDELIGRLRDALSGAADGDEDR